MYYSEDIVNEVRSRNDIVDVIGSYVKLKKQGSNYFGLCPFHNEKSPSFSVSQNKQIFHCFGCSKGGNVFTFIQEYENFTFPEALKLLADRCNIALPQQEASQQEKAEQAKRTQLLEINKQAAKYYYACLRSEAGALGLKYLTGRELSKETMQSFGLGYAPTGGGLFKYLRDQGFSEEILRDSGLFVHDEKRGIYDKFWNRVIFPIMDVNNRVIGFGGRVMGDGKPKYLNSPETRIFDKGRNLYGLNRARNSRAGYIILCEGYMDVISMHQAGFTQAVASLGTALTSGHAGLLKRYTKDVLLIYDSDNAGVAAALRAIPICKESGLFPRVVNLSPYKDPDEFIKALGADEFQKRLDEAENSFYFSIRMLERDYNMSDPDGRTRFIEEVADRISRMESQVERANYIQGVASKYMTPPEALTAAVAKAVAKNEGISVMQRPRSGVSERKKEAEDGNQKAQRLLLTAIVDAPEIFEQISRYLTPEDFMEGVNRTVAAALYEQLKAGSLDPAAIVSLFVEETDQAMVAKLFNSNFGAIETKSEREKYLTDLVVRIKKESLNTPGSAGDMDPLKAALLQRKQLDELRNIHISL